MLTCIRITWVIQTQMAGPVLPKFLIRKVWGGARELAFLPGSRGGCGCAI